MNETQDEIDQRHATWIRRLTRAVVIEELVPPQDMRIVKEWTSAIHGKMATVAWTRSNGERVEADLNEDSLKNFD